MTSRYHRRMQDVPVPGPGFEWDEWKAEYNLAKHGVSFIEAATAFADDLALIWPDELHSWDEYREIRLACSERGRLLAIVYTTRGERRRIISARLAEPHEHRRYDAYDENDAQG
jgi:uncharacterized DUF497 family protein